MVSGGSLLGTSYVAAGFATRHDIDLETALRVLHRLTDGIEVDAAAMRRLSVDGTPPLSVQEYAPTGGVTVPLPGDAAGVGLLPSLGRDPVLNPFRPARNALLQRSELVEEATLTQVFVEASAITERYGVRPGSRCIPCQHTTLTSPADFFSL